MTDPPKPFEGRNVHGWRLAVAAGAILGGLLVGAFKHEPAYLWGMGGGLSGGIIGWLGWRVGISRLPSGLKVPLAVLVVGGGTFAIWYLCKWQQAMAFTVAPQ